MAVRLPITSNIHVNSADLSVLETNQKWLNAKLNLKQVANSAWIANISCFSLTSQRVWMKTLTYPPFD